MNSKLSHYLLLLITAAALITLWLMTKNIAAVLLMGSILLTWIIIENHSKKIGEEYRLLVSRVEKLKAFSYDLQKLVDSELALVQEDVLRTRNIVADSIDILQAASLSIHATALMQDNEVTTLLADTAQLAQKNQMNSQMTLAQSGNSSIANFKAITDNNLQMKQNCEKLMQALQFEDIVSQVSERVAQHIGDIQQTVNILSNLCNSELSSTFDDDIQNMNKEYLSVKEKLVNISSKKIAAQKDMSEGDIDLF